MSYALWQEKFHFLGIVASHFVAQFNHCAPQCLAEVGSGSRPCCWNPFLAAVKMPSSEETV
jgi:hypothetical protein